MQLSLLFLSILAWGCLALDAKPHLFFVMVDDWGWYNVGFSGNSHAQTPVVDNLVINDAARLERHYAYKFCSPTRRSFLSG